MSRTVCSWCKAPLTLKDDILVCGNTDCPACDEKYPHEELIRTRKALEMTDTALLTIATNLDKVFPDTRLIFETIRIARKRIAEITALEQKE